MGPTVPPPPLIPAKAGTQAFEPGWFYVYILASQRNGTLYIGHTDDLMGRVVAHREHRVPGFTSRYDVTQLVWFEMHETRQSAFERERAMKKWRRLWKLELIENFNPGWRDLFEVITAEQTWVPASAGMSGEIGA